ncbi:MAG: DUF3131 domain-containing protein [Pleurocapsa sp. MO_192.B19]|nr:DUF3131 domain-containing protein [Pleurocapsa sp. MO_192.B19]
MQPELKPPPQKYTALVIISAVATALLAIAGLTWLSKHLSKNKVVEKIPDSIPEKTTEEKPKTPEALYALQDAQSLKLPGTKVTQKELQANKVPYIPTKASKLTTAELEVAKTAWKYFEHNWNEETGLVNSADKFPSVTLWDQSAAIAGLVSAKELEIIDNREFESKLSLMLTTLAKLELYNDELPNKVYNARTLIPVNYGGLEEKTEIGWYNGYYETLQEPNEALTANNNGIILESLLYEKVGKPLIVWAGVKTESKTSQPSKKS